tara:strand:- start:129 stop:2747 length:2619 start_codon:yes stop_codon:yes gene_type:complete
MNLIKKIFKENIGLFLTTGVVLIALMFIYSDTLDGTKSFYGAGDKVSARNVKEAVSKSEDYPYWFPWMMGGVPSVHSAQNISDYYPPNYIMKFLHSIGLPWFWNYIFHLLFAAIGMYLLCVRLKLSRFASSLSSLGFAVTPYMTGMLVHGHGSQVMTLCYMPWVFYAYIKLKDRQSIKNISILALLLALQLLRGHVQMAYYTWLMLAILIVIDLVYEFFVKKNKEIKWVIYTFISLCLGFICSLSLYIPILSYTPFSTRSAGEGNGAGLDYVTAYSFSLGEIATFFMPSFYGFGEVTYWGTMPFTSFPHYMSVIMLAIAFYGIIRYKWTRFKIFSILCIVFFLVLSFGKNFIEFYKFFYNYLPFFSKLRNPAFLLIIVQFCTMILSGMGLSMICEDIKNRSKFLPIFSCLAITCLSLSPFIIDFHSYAEKGYTKDLTDKIDEDKRKIERYKKEISIQENKKMQEFITADDIAATNYIPKEQLDQFKNEISAYYDDEISRRQEAIDYYSIDFKKIKLTESMILSDIWIMQLFIFISFALILGFYYIHPYTKEFDNLYYMFFGIIGVLVFLDFYFVDRRITNRERSDYIISADASSKYEDFYNTLLPFSSRDSIEPLITEIPSYSDTSTVAIELLNKKDNGEIFRVLDDNRFQSNLWARYHIENVLGYHPAKLKSYKDMIETDKGVSLYILSMLNVKYIIQGDKIDSTYLRKSEDRAFFVKNVKINNREGFDRYYNSYMPSDTSYVAPKAFENNAPTGVYSLTEYDKIKSIDNSNPNELIVNVETSGPQFLAISEIFYPNGWKATINNEEVDIYEVNDLIRGVYIDKKGSHAVRMWFEPSDLKWGRFISYTGFLTIFVLLFFEPLKNAYLRRIK